HLVDINHLILGVLSLLGLELRKNDIELRMELDQQLPPVEGDKVQLQQVVLNLIMNAVESMHSTQLRILWIRSGEGDPGIVQVSIEDTGTGVDPATASAFSSRCSRPNLTAWASSFPSVTRSSRVTTVEFG